jgi:anaerobic glycerol-3-phosphate dehydrogenase
MMPDHKRVAIIGGGISGLTAAHRRHELVLCQVWNEGYSRLSLVRASAVVNCQSIFAW